MEATMLVRRVAYTEHETQDDAPEAWRGEATRERSRARTWARVFLVNSLL